MVPEVRVERLDVPASLLACLPEPQAPEKPRTQRDVARHVVALRAAGDDCRSRLGRLHDLLTEGIR